ncbi:isopentenyl phosphate kinase [Arthrobacter globiformis]|nr:isopentenyl phosphate kinase [Arthrobacter globiformis]
MRLMYLTIVYAAPTLAVLTRVFINVSISGHHRLTVAHGAGRFSHISSSELGGKEVSGRLQITDFDGFDQQPQNL